MATDKAFVDVGGTSMIQRVLAALDECCSELLIVAKDPPAFAHLPARVIPDRFPLRAPLVGVCSGLREASNPWAFVAACDMPYISPNAVRLLADLAAGFDAAVPWTGGRWHPLHAVYATRTLPVFEARLADGEMRLWAALAALRVRRVTAGELEAADPGLGTLHNVNTAQQWRNLGGVRPERMEA